MAEFDEAVDLIMKTAVVTETADPDEEEDLDGDDQGDQSDDQQDEEEEGADDPDGTEEGSYSDEDLLEIVVDGVKQEVSIADLKKRYSGEGAIEKRLQEATELRKAANAEREAAKQEVEQHRANMLQTVQQLDQFLFMPLVQKPDPALRTKNMNQFLMQKDAYEEDQQRIADLRSAAGQVLAQHQQQTAKARETARQQESAMLLQKEPSLASQEGVTAFQTDLQRAIAHYGFTQEQLAGVDNHALFLMARDAGRYLKLADKTKTVPNARDETAGQKRVKRLLKSGAAQSASAGSQSVKARKAVEARARETGSVDDVAAMLLSNVRKPNGNSRRN